MIKLVPGADPTNASHAIEEAAAKLTDLHSAFSAIDRYNGYLAWASLQGNLLSHQLHSDEVDRLVTTRKYWSLLSLDPSTVMPGTLAELVNGEMKQRAVGLDCAKNRIRADRARWDNTAAVAVILDTGAWLKYFDDPMEHREWREVLEERPDVPLVLTVPMKVVDELDGHKRNRMDAPKGGKSVRMRAGLALKYLESHAAVPGERRMLQEGTMSSQPPIPAVHFTVLEQPLDRPTLPDADLEIIDRGRSILSYAKRVRIITTDRGMVYRAKQAGLDAIQVKGYEEELRDALASS